jgi:single-stranded-DNA-specific exonuclease
VLIHGKRIKRRSSEESTSAITGVTELLQRIYVYRGVETSDDLALDLKGLESFDQLKNIDQAAALLADHVQIGSEILIVGDFDADGATSTALAIRALRQMGAKNVSYLVPNRFEYGYGLSEEIVELACQEPPGLIVTVDNGISSVKGVELANRHDVPVLVTDHHLPASVLPDAAAIVNPNLPGDGFGSKHLAGVGVIFYVLAALRKELEGRRWFSGQGIPPPLMAQWLDLVALGTVADVVMLDRNNRILVEQGVRRIRQGYCCPGIRALIEIAGRSLNRIRSIDLGFVVGPRLNAAGRLDDMSLGIECLICDSDEEARRYASDLDEMNRARRDIQQDMSVQADQQLDQLIKKLDGSKPPGGVCLFDSNWHQGIVGLIAGKAREGLFRPVIAFASSGDRTLKGSGRSIPGVHIRDALDYVDKQSPGLILKFGGHAMAAGLTIREEGLDQFRKAFDDAIHQLADTATLEDIVLSDGELDERGMTLETAHAIQYAAPWGQGFPEPVFDGVFEVTQRRIVGEHHLKLVLSANDGLVRVDAIDFFYDPVCWPEDKQRFHVAYKLSVNEYRGSESLQLLIEHAIPLA